MKPIPDREATHTCRYIHKICQTEISISANNTSTCLVPRERALVFYQRGSIRCNRLTRAIDAIAAVSIITCARETSDGVSTSGVGVAVVCTDSAFHDVCVTHIIVEHTNCITFKGVHRVSIHKDGQSVCATK